jgi:hypothetical protein
MVASTLNGGWARPTQVTQASNLILYMSWQVGFIRPCKPKSDVKVK